MSAAHGQAAPPLGTTTNFAILAGAGITNTGSSVIIGTAALPGDLGTSTATIVGFPPGSVAAPGVIHPTGDGATIAAQSDLTTAYNNLLNRPATANLTGRDLGGLTLIPGVYNFSSSAGLTGILRLNALGNPNAVFIFNIASTLVTASASSVSLINGAQGGNVFWRVGSSATLGSATSFAGDILAQASITFDPGATIACGAAWARVGAVTLSSNMISLCNLVTVPGPGNGPPLGPTGVPLLASLLPSSATVNERSVANALDGFTSRGGTLPLGLLGLFGLSPSDLATALTQGSGEAATAVPQAGAQAMNSFLSLVTNPFAGDRGVAPDDLQSPRRGLVYKAPVYKAANEIAPDPRNWEIWSAAYGVQNRTGGDVLAGSHDLSARAFGYVTGLDYRVTPYTAIGFALAGGGTTFGVSEGLGGGQSDMFQSAVYSLTRVDSTYVSAALAYAWQHVSTQRTLTVAATDTLTAEFSANNVGGRIEGGHGFKVPGIFGLPGFVFTPYAALQAQAFRTPSYSEVAASGSSNFALAYDALTTTTTRTELGAWFEPTIALENGAILTLRTRAAWAYDHWSDTNVNAAFQSLPGSSFTVIGATPTRDSLLASASAEITYRNGVSLAGLFNTELAEDSQTYSGFLRLRYTW